jgi:RNA polymerase sigma factor (sigma-70 family)
MFGSRQPSDEQILDKLRKGEEKMLVFLYKRNYEPVRSYVARNSGMLADAEDVLQESLVILWQKIQSGNFELSSKLDTFIYAIAKNLWMKELRKTSRMTSTDFGSDDPPEAEDAEAEPADDKAAVLAKYMGKLGETCRELLSLFYFEQWDMEQIAEKMHFANAQTAKAKKYQCKKKLEELIKAHYTAEDLL